VPSPEPGEDDVVLTVPASAEFGDVARRAVGELARRRGFDARQWAELETAVAQTLSLLRCGRGERIRFTFEARDAEIVVEAELTGGGGGRRRRLGGEAIEDFHSSVDPIVERPEVDPGAGRVRFSKSRR
jgi:hypothetical protein